jgi:hypothetical protein
VPFPESVLQALVWAFLEPNVRGCYRPPSEFMSLQQSAGFGSRSPISGMLVKRLCVFFQYGIIRRRP